MMKKNISLINKSFKIKYISVNAKFPNKNECNSLTDLTTPNKVNNLMIFYDNNNKTTQLSQNINRKNVNVTNSIFYPYCQYSNDSINNLMYDVILLKNDTEILKCKLFDLRREYYIDLINDNNERLLKNIFLKKIFNLNEKIFRLDDHLHIHNQIDLLLLRIIKNEEKLKINNISFNNYLMMEKELNNLRNELYELHCQFHKLKNNMFYIFSIIKFGVSVFIIIFVAVFVINFR